MIGEARANFAANRVRSTQAGLLREINQGLPAETWRHYGELKEERRAQRFVGRGQRYRFADIGSSGIGPASMLDNQ